MLANHRDLQNIVQTFAALDHGKHQVALATVINVRGSAYRSPGARMMIIDDGRWVGSVSGGCLEGDVLRKARKVMNDLTPITVTYDTRESSHQQLVIALGCEGVIDIFIEPISYQNPGNPVEVFKSFIETESPMVMATIFDSDKFLADKCIMNADEHVIRRFKNESLMQTIIPDLQNALRNGRPEECRRILLTDNARIFIEVIQPAIRLILFGAGFDARPVSQLAKNLGWKVSVTDECVAHIAPAFFPQADKLSLCKREFIDREIKIDSNTACVLMSHNYDYDKEVLRKVLSTDAPYIGILGPKKRLDGMLEELAVQNVTVTENDLNRIHAPIGLDIGAEAPDEIAISIVAEIMGKFAHREGGFLKLRIGPIHTRAMESEWVLAKAL